MVERTINAEEIVERNLLDVLREVVKRQERLTVILPDKQAVSIRPAAKLKPLPKLKGYIREGWKDEIYEQ